MTYDTFLLMKEHRMAHFNVSKSGKVKITLCGGLTPLDSKDMYIRVSWQLYVDGLLLTFVKIFFYWLPNQIYNSVIL